MDRRRALGGLGSLVGVHALGCSDVEEEDRGLERMLRKKYHCVEVPLLIPNSHVTVVFISKKSEAEGISDLRVSNGFADLEDAYVYAHDENLWIEVGKTARSYSNGNEGVELQVDLLKDIFLTTSLVTFYHIHRPYKNVRYGSDYFSQCPNFNAMGASEIRQDILVKSPLGILPSRQDIVTLAYLSALQGQCNSRGRFSSVIVTEYGLTTYSLTPFGLLYVGLLFGAKGFEELCRTTSDRVRNGLEENNHSLLAQERDLLALGEEKKVLYDDPVVKVFFTPFSEKNA